MKWRDWLARWGMTSLRLSAGFLAMEFNPQDADRRAAWDLYVELLTRIATQSLAEEDGDEATALASIHALFGVTRETLKQHGTGCAEFAKIAVVVLNQVLRPFAAKWHRAQKAGAFEDPVRCAKFRAELETLRQQLHRYMRMLADMAGVEDLTQIEDGQEP